MIVSTLRVIIKISSISQNHAIIITIRTLISNCQHDPYRHQQYQLIAKHFASWSLVRSLIPSLSRSVCLSVCQSVCLSGWLAGWRPFSLSLVLFLSLSSLVARVALVLLS